MQKSPVIVFAYKRADKLFHCLSSLNNCYGVKDTDLFVFCDGPKYEKDNQAVSQVRELLEEQREKLLFHDVTYYYSERNKGLANSIIEGVTKIVNLYNTAIVVEDDLVVSRDFLDYMNSALDYFADDMRYGSISAYTLPLKKLKKYSNDIYVTRKGDCWGWGTWKNRWNQVDWEVSDYGLYKKNCFRRWGFNSLQVGLDKMLEKQMNGEVDSWAVRWCYHLYKNHLLTVYPRETRTINIGVDGTGTHCDKSEIYQTLFEEKNLSYRMEKYEVDRSLEHAAAVYERNQSIKNQLLIWGNRFVK